VQITIEDVERIIIVTLLSLESVAL
jgi:hypothetical protein